MDKINLLSFKDGIKWTYVECHRNARTAVAGEFFYDLMFY